MKANCIVILVFLLSGFGWGDKIVSMSELINPESFSHPINVENDKIFITDGIKVLVYSSKDFKLINSIGKPGEGPGEFLGYDQGRLVTSSLTSENIVVSSMNKMTFFSKDGKFLNEKKTSNGFMFITFGTKFVVGYSTVAEGRLNLSCLNLYDSKFTKVMELARSSQLSLQAKFSPFFFHRPKPIVYGSKLYVSNLNTGIIDVYGMEGQKLKPIIYDFEKIKITNAGKKKIRDFYKNDLRIKQIYHQIKNLIDFPEYYPFIMDFHIADDRIYILTYKKEENTSEFVILDINGKFINKIMLPLPQVNSLETCPYTIYNGKFYMLEFDEDSEMWNLHINDLK